MDQPEIRADESTGTISDVAAQGNSPYPTGSYGWCRYLSNLSTPGGASGGPVLFQGIAAALNSKSFELPDGTYLSTGVPLRHILNIEVELDLGPSKPDRMGVLSIKKLIELGDISHE